MRILVAIGIIFFLTVLTTKGISLLPDWWWFNEVGYQQVFIKPFVTQVILGLGTFTFFTIFVLGNILAAGRSKTPWIRLVPKELTGQAMTITQKQVNVTAIVLTTIVGLLFGFILSFFWEEVLLFINQVPFGQNDPLFGKDISWYLFTLPIYSVVLGSLSFMLFATTIAVFLIYLIKGSLGLEMFAKFFGLKKAKQIEQDKRARMHVSILGFLLLAVIAVQTYLSIYGLATKDNGIVFGAGYTDVSIVLPIVYISVGIFAFLALVTLFYGISGKQKPLYVGVGLYVVVQIAAVVLPSTIQQFIVAPNELVKETPYIDNAIKSTQKAYALDVVNRENLSGETTLTAEDIKANETTLNNVRLWDRGPLLSTFSQIQEIRTYYEFASIDNDRYMIDGQLQQLMLSPRELSSDTLPNKNWINERLIFTHGYGAAVGPVNEVTSEGLPVLYVQDLPPKTSVPELEIKRPEIYFGELSNDHVIVNTKQKEFDYPQGDQNVQATYEGDGGVAIDSFWKKIMYALHFESTKIILSEDITSESRVMYHRNIKERLEKVAPFLTFDNDPYSVIADGKFYWIADAYTMSNDYPYSQRSSFNGRPINYIRNSVKVVIDAYDGKITMYRTEANDPIISAYEKAFPGMFKSINDMPESLYAHIRYPEDIFTLQTNMYTTYHMDDPAIFYNKEDQWDIPAIAVEGEGQTADIPPMAPRHIIMKLPGEETEEYILMIPYNPRGKDNLSAWMIARNDGENYGKLSVYHFPKQKLVYGPKQIIGRINQDPEISRQIALWDQRGSQVIQGPLLIIPVEESLLYVRPLYLKAESGKIPELERVIVAYENRISMQPTLDQAISEIFGTEVDSSDEDTTEEPAQDESDEPSEEQPTIGQDTERLQEASRVYERAMEALRNGNWTEYGNQLDRLGELLK